MELFLLYREQSLARRSLKMIVRILGSLILFAGLIYGAEDVAQGNTALQEPNMTMIPQTNPAQNTAQDTQTPQPPLAKGQRDPSLAYPPNTPTPKITRDVAPTYVDNFKRDQFQAQPTLNAAIALAKKGEMEQALKLFSQSCDEGNPAGCFGAGLMHMYGQGTINDQQKAVAYYQEACSGGDAVACTNLAIAYDDGVGIQMDKERALQYYLVGCEGGDSISCTNAGWMYANGVGTPKNYYQSLNSYNKACNLGSELGCYNLGLMSNTYNVYGVDKDRLGALDMNYIACSQGDMVGCANLGYLYSTGEAGAPLNYYNAAKYFDLACQNGVLSACNNLAVLYDNGRGVLQDRLRAMELFALACQNGFETSCQNYRIMNSNSRGSTRILGW